jgi:hypothetical protein
MVCAVGKEAVTENSSLPLEDNNDTLLFEKLQEHVLAHCPNPSRKGCPSPAVLKSLIETPGEVTLADLNNLHIFRCAECTRLVMELRQKKKHCEISE